MERRGRGRARRRPHGHVPGRLRPRMGTSPLPAHAVTVLAIFAALLVIYLIGFFNIETKQSLDQWGKGW